jgi:hypothetical protein
MRLNQYIEVTLCFLVVAIAWFLIRRVKIYGGIYEVVSWHGLTVAFMLFCLFLICLVSRCN